MYSYCTALHADRVIHVLKCSRTELLQDYYDRFAQGTAAVFMLESAVIL